MRVQDRLMYFMITIGAFSPVTVRGLIYTYARGFITNSCLASATQAPLASLSKKRKPLDPLRPSSASRVSAAQPL